MDVCCSFCILSDLLASSHSLNSCRFAFLFFFLFSFLIFMAWPVLLCSRARYASISLPLPRSIGIVWFTLFLSMSPHHLYVSRMKNQHGHWVYSCRRVELTVYCEDNTRVTQWPAHTPYSKAQRIHAVSTTVSRRLCQ